MTSVQLPERLWWDHNAYYHRWLLRQLPARCGRVLDVGCGSGRLACRIASSTGAHVDALDRSPIMIEQAYARCPCDASVRWLEDDVLDPALPLPAEAYDAVTAVSSRHHMPLEPAVARLANLPCRQSCTTDCPARDCGAACTGVTGSPGVVARDRG